MPPAGQLEEVDEEEEEKENQRRLKRHHGCSSSRNFLPDLSGAWKVRDIDNLDGLLAAAGAPWIVRKLLVRSFAKASMAIEQKKNVIYVEDKSVPGRSSMLKFVEGVDNHRKDPYGIKIRETCKWEFDTSLGVFVWSLNTHGYHNDRYGPVISRYYFDQAEKDVLVSEIVFCGQTMLRHWVHDIAAKSRLRKVATKPSTVSNRKVALQCKSFPSSSEKHSVSSKSQLNGSTKILLYGKGGWIGCQVATILVKQDIEFEFGEARLENKDAISKDLQRVNPTHVINAAGRVGDDSSADVDVAMMASNLVGTLNLAAACWEGKVHLTYFSEIQANDGKAKKSFYIWTKEKAEEMLAPFKENLLILQVGVALNADLKNPNSGFERLRRKAAEGHYLENVPAYVSILPELLPMALDIIERKVCGTVKLVNPGQISESRLFHLHKQYVLPDLEWKRQDSVSEDIQYISVRNLGEEGNPLSQALDAEESLHKYIFAPNMPEEEDLASMGGFCGLACAPHWKCFSVMTFKQCKSLDSLTL